jgi:hypothetical protein
MGMAMAMAWDPFRPGGILELRAWVKSGLSLKYELVNGSDMYDTLSYTAWLLIIHV